MTWRWRGLSIFFFLVVSFLSLKSKNKCLYLFINKHSQFKSFGFLYNLFKGNNDNNLTFFFQGNNYVYTSFFFHLKC